MSTHVFLDRSLLLTLPFGPSAPDHRLKLTVVLVTGLHRRGRL
jgi:hypothetical protein